MHLSHIVWSNWLFLAELDVWFEALDSPNLVSEMAYTNKKQLEFMKNIGIYDENGWKATIDNSIKECLV